MLGGLLWSGLSFAWTVVATLFYTAAGKVHCCRQHWAADWKRLLQNLNYWTGMRDQLPIDGMCVMHAS